MERTSLFHPRFVLQVDASHGASACPLELKMLHDIDVTGQKGGPDNMWVSDSNPTNISTNPNNAHKSNDIDPIPHQVPSDIDETPSEPNERPKQSRKATERVHNLISGQAVSDYRPKLGQKIAIGVQLPTINPPQPDESAPVIYDENNGGKFGLAADFVDEYSMVAEMRESEALEP